MRAPSCPVMAMGDDGLRLLATGLIGPMKKCLTSDWRLRESARSKIRVMVKRLLAKYA